jgi:hypothetical protein
MKMHGTTFKFKKFLYQRRLLYPYYDLLVGLKWSNDPESYAGRSLATGRISRARQIKGDNPTNKGYSDPLVWGVSVGLTTPPHREYVLLRISYNWRS